MHICYLCNEYPPAPHGGIGVNTQTLARALAGRGHTVSVIGVYRSSTGSVEEDFGVHVIRLPHTPVRGTGFAVNGRRLRRALEALHRERPIDVLEGPEWGLALVSKAFPAVKLVRMHGGHHFFSVALGKSPRFWRSWLETRSFACADRFCAVSQYVADETRRLLRLGSRPIEVIPNPVDVDRFQPRPGQSAVEGRIVFVGTVCEKKGIRQLVQAFPAIAAQVPSAHLWVVGRDGRDDGGDSFTAMLRSLIPPALAHRVTFKGPISNDVLPDVIATAQVCVYPSHMEAAPIVILEAMAMGKAVVASSKGPTPEQIQDGVSGLLCDPHQPALIASCVTTVLQDAGLRASLGAQARIRAERSFSLTTLVKHNEEFYARCLATTP